MGTHDFQRRTILHGTLAAGAILVLFGCKAKQQGESTTGTQSTPAPDKSLPASQTSPSPAGATLGASAPNPKMTKILAQYQTQPKGDSKCANCRNFIADSKTCKVVEGQVSPDGWCMMWTAL